MGKLVIKLSGKLLDQVELKQGDMKIGRRAGCDIVLDHPAVSGEHAKVSTSGEESLIQDLGSTNGTFVDGKRVTRHPLKQGDAVMIGQHTLVYVEEHSGVTERIPAVKPAPDPASGENRTVRIKHGQLFVLEGPNAGKRIELVHTQTNLTPSGENPGVITRLPDGYRLDAPGKGLKLNGQPVSPDGAELKNGDMIEFPGARMQFYFK